MIKSFTAWLSSACKISDRLIRHRACSLKDTAYSIVKEEIDEDLEQRCEEIKESRKKRGMYLKGQDFKSRLCICNWKCKTDFFAFCSLSQGCSSSEYAPDFYTVMAKENSAPGCKKTDAECSDKTKMTVTPVDASTPVSKGKLQFIQTFWVNLPMSLILSPVLLWHKESGIRETCHASGFMFLNLLQKVR